MKRLKGWDAARGKAEIGVLRPSQEHFIRQAGSNLRRGAELMSQIYHRLDADRAVLAFDGIYATTETLGITDQNLRISESCESCRGKIRTELYMG